MTSSSSSCAVDADVDEDVFEEEEEVEEEEEEAVLVRTHPFCASVDGMMMTVVDVLKGGWDVLGIELDHLGMRSNNISITSFHIRKDGVCFN